MLTLRLLTEEVGSKSQAISILDQEKSALIRDLFQVLDEGNKYVYFWAGSGYFEFHKMIFYVYLKLKYIW